MKQNIDQSSWLSSPYNVRLFILRFMCQKGYCRQQISVGHCIELLKHYSYNFDTNYAFGANEGTWRDNVLHFEDLVIAWDGPELVDICWYHAVNSIKKQLAQPFIHEFVS